MPSEKDNSLAFNQNMKPDKMTNTIYADIESLVKKIDGCANNPESPSTAKIGENNTCGYLISKIWAFKNIENKYNLYRWEDCIKKFVNL